MERPGIYAELAWGDGESEVVMPKEILYLVFDGRRKARVLTKAPYLRLDETAFKVVVSFPSPRAIAGNIELTIGENVATVDGVEMIPLALTVETKSEETP